MMKSFRDPGPEFGPIDCWWWDAARLSEEKLKWQLEQMSQQGVAGTWWYPRFLEGPLRSDPPYWSDRWWDMTAFSMQQHQRLGMVSWFSDWTAKQVFQNKVRAERERNPGLTGHRLAIHETESSGPMQLKVEVPAEEQVLHAAAYRKTEAGLDWDSQIPLGGRVKDGALTWKAPQAGWVLAVVTAQPHDLDYLDRAVVDRWMELLLGEYEARLSSFVGNTLQAYGPDEMFVLNGSILYSPCLAARFEGEKGYDPLPLLVGIFHDIGGQTDRVRCDYLEVMTSILDENLYAPFADWLHQRGMIYATIATWGRGSPLDQTFNYGDFFRMMSHFDVTGNEDPNVSEAGGRCFIDAKFSSSLAHLCGRERTAVCAYWGSGWGVTQEQNLAWTNENYAYGVNLYNRHGALFSRMGGWYEWVPPAVHFYQPYWQYWRQFTDYVRRLSYVMSRGRHRADVALLYPLTTIHAHWSGGKQFGPAARKAEEGLKKLAGAIYRSGIDFDFVDERSLCSAEVREGELVVSGMPFRAVLMPPLTTIRRATLEKLRQFHDAGGTIVGLGRLPGASPEHGRDDPAVRSMVQEMFGVSPGEDSTEVVASTGLGGGKAFFVPDDEGQVPYILSGAIARDVVVSEGDVFHTHQKTDEADIYFLFNVRAEKRRITASFRVDGEPEVWDAFTGGVRPVHRFCREGEGTRVILDVGPHEGVVLVFVASQGRPRVIDDDLDSIAARESGDGVVRVRGLCESGGEKRIRVTHKGLEYSAEADVAPPPAPIALDGPWDFLLQPTMDNQWGDFRYPPSDGFIGAEARRFRYMEEDRQPGTALGWHGKDFDDSGWERVTYTYGPYWWALGPFEEGREPGEVVEEARAGHVDIRAAFEVGGRTLRWRRFGFSRKYGHQAPTQTAWGGLEGVPQNFISLEAAQEGTGAVRYLFANVHCPQDGEWTLDFGGRASLTREAWVNGERVLSTSDQEADARARVQLQEGWNRVLLRIVQPEGKAMQTYAAFFEGQEPPPLEPFVPLLRWFRGPQKLRFDIMPDRDRPVGWYRFAAPPGLKAMRLRLNARSVRAWVDGEPVTPEAIACKGDSKDGSPLTISLTRPSTGPCQVTLRVEQRACCYGGAAFDEPVTFECGPGRISLGDWCECGLDTYSGAGVYSRTVTLGKDHLEGKVYLDLGRAVTVAEVTVNGRAAGVNKARPFRFDVSDLVREGENEIQVKVASTLANHMSTYPTQRIYEGQTVAGLLGPVELRFAREVTLTATPTAS